MACLVGARGPNTTDLSIAEIQALLQAMEDHQNLNGLQRLKGEFAKNNQLQEIEQAGKMQNQLCEGENTLQAPLTLATIKEQKRLKTEENILKQKQESLKQYQNKKPITIETIADELGGNRIFQAKKFQTTNDKEKEE